MSRITREDGDIPGAAHAFVSTDLILHQFAIPALDILSSVSDDIAVHDVVVDQ